jgi:hypothetical protein
LNKKLVAMTLIDKEITLHFLVCIIELCGICEVCLTLILFILLQYVFLIVANNYTETTKFRLTAITVNLPARTKCESQKTQIFKNDAKKFNDVVTGNIQEEEKRLSLKPLEDHEYNTLIHEIIPTVKKYMVDCGVEVSIFGNPKNALLLCVFRASCGPSTWLPVPFLLWVLPAFRGMWPYDFPYITKSLCISNLMSENGMTRFKINQQDQWGHCYDNLSVLDKTSAYIRSIAALLGSSQIPSTYPHTNSDNRRNLSDAFYQNHGEDSENHCAALTQEAKQGRPRSFDTRNSKEDAIKIQHTVMDYTGESTARPLFPAGVVVVGYKCEEIYPPRMEKYSSIPLVDKSSIVSSELYKYGEARAAVLNITGQRKCNLSITLIGRKKNPGRSIILNSSGWRLDVSKMDLDEKSSIFAFGVGSSVLLIVKKGWVFIGVREPGGARWIFDHTLILNAAKTLGLGEFYIKLTLTGRGHNTSMAITTPGRVPHVNTPKNTSNQDPITTLGCNAYFVFVAKIAEHRKLQDLIKEKTDKTHPEFFKVEWLWKNSDDIFNIGDPRQMSEKRFRVLSKSIIEQGFLPPNYAPVELEITQVFSIKLKIHGSDKEKVLLGFVFNIPGINIGKKTGVLATSNMGRNEHLRIEKMLDRLCVPDGVSIEKISVYIKIRGKIESRLGRS